MELLLIVLVAVIVWELDEIRRKLDENLRHCREQRTSQFVDKE